MGTPAEHITASERALAEIRSLSPGQVDAEMMAAIQAQVTLAQAEVLVAIAKLLGKLVDYRRMGR